VTAKAAGIESTAKARSATMIAKTAAIPVLRFPTTSGRNLADPARPQPPGDDLGRWLCAEPMELADSSSKSAIIVRVGKREGGFVGAADLRP
jgi:hypothetical protein